MGIYTPDGGYAGKILEVNLSTGPNQRRYQAYSKLKGNLLLMLDDLLMYNFIK